MQVWGPKIPLDKVKNNIDLLISQHSFRCVATICRSPETIVATKSRIPRYYRCHNLTHIFLYVRNELRSQCSR